MKNTVAYSSASVEWSTPRAFFDALDQEFGFTLDVCATAENAKCRRFFTIADDGLSQPWSGVVWMNPPYGTQISRWVKKAWASAQQGATVVCLLPARTETRWWHGYVMRATEIRFICGRIRFSGMTENAPYPNAVVVFTRDAGSPRLTAMNRILDVVTGGAR